jgi:transposase
MMFGSLIATDYTAPPTGHRCSTEATAMMGTKERAFAPLCNLSLEALVPADHFYRHLDAKLDLDFVRHLVAGCYAASGRPSVDPVVFFKLQLVMFFSEKNTAYGWQAIVR